MTAPYLSDFMDIQPEWIDFNGHLNMAYYGVLFDQSVDQAFLEFGLGPDYRERTGFTTYSAEFHIRYLRELHMGDRVRASFQILDAGPKAFHFVQELIHEDGWVAATGEGISLHVDQSGPRVAPYPAEIKQKIYAMAAAHADLPVPDYIGKPMAIRR